MAVFDYRGWRFLRGKRQASDVGLALLDAVQGFREANVALLEELRAGRDAYIECGNACGAPSLMLGNG